MGKATIVSDLGAGEYTARINFDTKRAEAEIVSANKRIAEIDEELSLVASERSSLQSEIDSLQDQLDAQISSGSELEALFSIVEQIADKTAKLAPIRLKESQLKAAKLSAQKRIAFIESGFPADEIIPVWCADYSEGLSGEVGTIEPNGTLEAAPIIYPNEIEGSAYNPARDSQFQPIISSGAPAVYFNRAIFPAWQKWKPTYRIGTLTAKSGDVCSVSLDQVLSDQNLNVNQAGTLTNIPIAYMNQNGTVFEVGDRVVVKFENQDFTQPKVIGFEDHPKPEAFVWLLNDTFSTAIDQPFIKRHNPDGGGALSVTTPPSHNGYARRLERSGSDLYFYLYDSDTSAHTLVRATSAGATTQIAGDCDRLFGVNSTHVFYYEADFQIYSKKIIKRDRITGALIGSFDATIPSQAVGEEERPLWLSCNDQFVYWAMSPDTYNNSPIRICRSDLDGLNHEVVATYPFAGSTTGADGSWRWMHLTEDRIFVPDGKNSGLDSEAWFPINCFIYDLDMNYIGSFGSLPFANGLNGTSAETCEGFSANQYMAAWLEDNYSGGVYLHVWDRVITRNSNGDITSDTWQKRAQTPQNLRSTYGGIKGGIAV